MLKFSNKWVRRKIASDPDIETEAGPPLLFGSRRFGPDPDYREPEPEWKIPTIERRMIRQPFFTIKGRKTMSYSFVITAASKVDASIKVAAEFNQVVAAQSPHATDKEAVITAANAFIDILREPNTDEQISVNVYGSLGWEGDYSAPTAFISGNVNVSVSIQKTKSN